MPDQVERIVLEIDDAKALLATARTNAALAAMEKRAGVAIGSLGRVPQTVAAGIASVTQSSANQINRIVADAEKKAAAMGKSASQRLMVERDLILKRVSGDADAVHRVTEAYAKMGDTGGSAFDKIKSGAMWVAGTAVAIGAAASAVFHFVKGQTDAAESMQNLSDRTGLTIQEVHLYTAVTKAAGLDVNALAMGMKRLSEAMVDGGPANSKAAKGLADIGVKAFDSTQQLKTTGTLLLEIGNAIAKLPTDAQRIRAVTNIFGKGGMELLPMFKNLPQQLQTMKELGYGFDDGVTQNLLRGDQAIDKLEASWARLKQRFASGIVTYVDILSQGGPVAGGEAVGAIRGLMGIGRGMQRLGGLAFPGSITGVGPAFAAPSAEFAGIFQQGAERRVTGAAWSQFAGGSGELQLQLRLGEAQEKLKTAIADKDVTAARAAWTQVEALKKQNEELQKQQALAEKLGTFQMTEGDIPDSVTGRRRWTPSLLTGSRGRPFPATMGGPALVIQQAAIDAAGAGMDEARTGQARAQLTGLWEIQQRSEAAGAKALEHQIRMVELTAGPGGEAAAVEKIYQLRLAGAKTAEDSQQAINDREEGLYRIQKQRFDELRSSFEGLFDAAFGGARSFWDAVKRMALSVFLTPVKRALSGWVANALTGGGGGGGGFGGSGGFAGALGGMLGGGFGGGITAGAPELATGAGMAGLALGPGAMGAGGGGGSLGSLASGAGSLGLMAKLGAMGPMFALGGAGLIAGGISRRNTTAGLAMGAGGGALAAIGIGMMFGGPIGALVGAGIGLGIVLFSRLWKTAEQRVIDKVQQLYGIRIDRSLAAQIVEMGKSQFGGNLDMAVRAPATRELIELYSMATGQGMKGLAVKQFPTTFSQSGGRLTQVPNFFNGAPYSAPVQTTGLGGGQTVNVNLDRQATREFLSGRMATAIVQNPRAVGAAQLESGRQSSGRRELAAQMLTPGLVLA